MTPVSSQVHGHSGGGPRAKACGRCFVAVLSCIAILWVWDLTNNAGGNRCRENCNKDKENKFREVTAVKEKCDRLETDYGKVEDEIAKLQMKKHPNQDLITKKYEELKGKGVAYHDCMEEWDQVMEKWGLKEN